MTPMKSFAGYGVKCLVQFQSLRNLIKENNLPDTQQRSQQIHFLMPKIMKK